MSRRSVLIESLEATPRDLARLLSPVDATKALQRALPGEWCIADVVAHFGDVEERYLARLRQIVAEDNPSVVYIHPDDAAHNLSRPLAELLAAFVERRGATIEFLRGLEQRDWGRRCLHPTIGPSRLRDQVQALVSHDNTHLEQIVALREAAGVE
jgi:hypothetical protein